MADTSHDIRTLNSLIATVIDSIDGYSESAKDADSSRFASMFNDRAAERRQVLTTLQAEVGRLGGNADDELSPQVKAVVQQCFTSVKQGHDQMSALKHSMEAAS